MNRFLVMLLLLASVRVQADVPMAPQELCIDDECVAAQASSQGVKWHPGHYMLVFRGEGLDTVLNSRIPEVCKESALQGLQYRVQWYDLESTRGSYTFGDVDRIYSALEACGKRLVLQVMAVEFGGTDSDGIVPEYVRTGAEFNGGVARTNSGYIARLWEAPVMDRFIALSRALAARYDQRPYFEGIVVAETATSGVEDGYSAEAWIAQLKRAIPAMVTAWPSTNVIVYNNFLQGSSDSQFVDFVQFLSRSRAALGGPDVLPPPHSGSKSERIFRGELGGVDLRGAMPVAMAVQTPELGGKEGTFTPQELYDHCVDTNRCNHMFWIRNTTTGGAAQQWGTGILPFIRQNPRTNETCPSSFSACKR